MASEGSVSGAVRPDWRAAVSLADAGYLAFLLLVFVGLHPFEPRNAAALLHGADESGSGNLLRQIAFGITFVLIAVAAWREMEWKVIQAVPVSLLLLIAWCLLSASWAAEPLIALRRAVLEGVIVGSVFLSVASLGSGRSLTLLCVVLSGVLLVNWLSIPLVPEAVHLPGEADISLIGDWRGLYFHKNIAGAVSALSALVFFFAFLNKRRIWDGFLFAAAAAFTVMTHSKTSIALLPVALCAGLVYRLAWARALDRQIALVVLALVTLTGIVAVLSEWNAIAHLLADPEELSGRAEIWRAELSYIADHPFLGAGFGSFADTGGHSPLSDYISSAWIANISHGHSGYLQLLVTIGGIGFALAMWSVVVTPAWNFLAGPAHALETKAILFAIFVFVVSHNILESDYLEGDAAAWVLLLVALAMLKDVRGSTR